MAQTIKTLAILRRERPAVIIVASPPLFSVLAVYLHCKVFGGQYIIDAHTGIFLDAKCGYRSLLFGVGVEDVLGDSCERA